MHLFVIHQFPELDNFAAIIKTLSDREKVLIISIYPVHDFKKYKILRFLLKHNVEYLEITSLSLSLRALKHFVVFLEYLSKKNLLKSNFIWKLIYYKNIFINKKLLDNLHKKKCFNSVNIDDALPFIYRKIFFSFAKDFDLLFLTYKTGVDMVKNKIYNYKKLEFSDKIIIQDNHYKLIGENIKNKVYKSCHRYCEQWLSYSEHAYNYQLKDYNCDLNTKRKKKIVIFTRSLSSSKNRWGEIYDLINALENTDVKIKIKPRGNFQPLDSQKNSQLDLSTSELINWCDIVVSHTSSVLVEAVIKRKKILFLEHLSKFKEDLLIRDYNCFTKITSDIQLTNFIKEFKIKNENYHQNSKFLEKVLGKNYKEDNILEKLIDKLYY